MREIKFEPAPPSGSARHLPMNGEDRYLMVRNMREIKFEPAPPSGSARHLPMNGEDSLLEAPEYA